MRFVTIDYEEARAIQPVFRCQQGYVPILDKEYDFIVMYLARLGAVPRIDSDNPKNRLMAKLDAIA